jgi:hypothetical protein
MNPTVNIPASHFAGRYRLGREYRPAIKGTNTNHASWEILKAMFRLYPFWDYADLAVAVRHHKHGSNATTPQAFIQYLARNGHIIKLGDEA